MSELADIFDRAADLIEPEGAFDRIGAYGALKRAAADKVLTSAAVRVVRAADTPFRFWASKDLTMRAFRALASAERSKP